ncbi:hypothetical protein EDB87DRAFT_1108180 [Lactarius vividus]|nr:hypothetical protein EDB87DRAFT_1108180 [Lactarius vividus]
MFFIPSLKSATVSTPLGFYLNEYKSFFRSDVHSTCAEDIRTAKLASDSAGEPEFTVFSLHRLDTSENCVSTIPQVIPTSTDYHGFVPTGMAAGTRSLFGPGPKSCGYQTQVVQSTLPSPPFPSCCCCLAPSLSTAPFFTFSLTSPSSTSLNLALNILPSSFIPRFYQHESTWCINTGQLQAWSHFNLRLSHSSFDAFPEL